MGRIYTARFANVGVTAVQDLVSLLPGASMAIAIHEIVVGQVNNTSISNLQISLKRLSGTITAGSGGTAPTPQKLNNGDAAAVTVARVNDTTQASATTTSVLRSDVYNTINTYQFLPPPEDRPIIAPNQEFVVSLDTAPAASQTTSCTITFEELT